MRASCLCFFFIGISLLSLFQIFDILILNPRVTTPTGFISQESNKPPPHHDRVGSSNFSFPKKSRRKFISYTPSTWEQMWLDNVDEWTREKSICQRLLGDQVEYVLDFLNLICTRRHERSGWCIIHDTVLPLFFQTNPEFRQGLIQRYENDPENQNRNFTDVPWLTFLLPPGLVGASDVWQEANQVPVEPGPQHEHIVSKFVFLDEYTGETFVEYIEPLVSHLRHPLANCIQGGVNPYYLIVHRGYIIPPPRRRHVPLARIYFDAGASSWNDGAGGPSLSYFTNIWKRHGIDFDRIYAREMRVNPSDFYATVPQEYQSKVFYRKVAISSRPQDETLDHPFIPREIERLVATTLQEQNNEQGTYVLFKLDIDSPDVETGSIRYILEQEERTVDEIAWEHHVRGNYLMQLYWCFRDEVEACPQVSRESLAQSYDLFLRMRKKGIRAHSWV